MKAYLLLDNGFMVEGTLFGHSHNMMGELKTNENGQLVLHCSEFNQDCVLSVQTASLKEGNSAFFSADMDSATTKLNDFVPTYAKVIIDEMDVDYHLYDLKTYIPNVHLHAKQKTQKKEAA